MIVRTARGILRGRQENGARVFKGVPYAQPPVGELRFCPPQPVIPWEGVREAVEFSAICPQAPQEEGSFYHKEFYADPAFMPPMSEDCLYLNIWAPEGEGPFPVAIWFHGGAYLHGFGSEMEFDGAGYARRGVILVTVNYRVGFLGFFAHPELPASGNCGIRDQIAAIDWVRENIAAFGGDPENITIFGQSAGGGSVQTLVRSPGTRGKVHRAIIQSAGGYRSPIGGGTPLAKLEKACVKFMKAKKLTLQDMRSLPAGELVAMQKDFMRYGMLYTGNFLALAPCVDGDILPMSWDAALERGALLPIPYMIGSTKNDIMVRASGIRNKEKNKLHTSARNMCVMNSAAGRPSYCYYFQRQMPGDDAGAFHSSELWYMFATLDRCWRPLTDRDRELSERMMDAWTDFMKTGNPGWEPCTRENPVVKIFDIEPHD